MLGNSVQSEFDMNIYTSLRSTRTEIGKAWSFSDSRCGVLTKGLLQGYGEIVTESSDGQVHYQLGDIDMGWQLGAWSKVPKYVVVVTTAPVPSWVPQMMLEAVPTSLQASSAVPTSAPSPSTRVNFTAIAGGAAGGLAILTLAILATVFCKRMQNRRRRLQDFEDIQECHIPSSFPETDKFIQTNEGDI